MAQRVELERMATKDDTKKASRRRPSSSGSSYRFESAKIESLFIVLDAIAWMNAPNSSQIAQFGGLDPRTVGKLLKNAINIGLIDTVSKGYVLLLPYPYQGNRGQKEAVVREALVRHPLLTALRQFMLLGDKIEDALRKAATLTGISPFNSSDLNPLLEWAHSLNALRPNLIAEDLIDAATENKEQRHQTDSKRRIAFLSHSSLDKPFIRQLAADLTANGIGVWLDEQHIRVGDSIPEKIAQGLAESDYFLLGISQNSLNSEWVKKELNNALVNEVERRKVHILPLKLDNSRMPSIIADKKYADFSNSYKTGLHDLIDAIKRDIDGH